MARKSPEAPQPQQPVAEGYVYEDEADRLDESTYEEDHGLEYDPGELGLSDADLEAEAEAMYDHDKEVKVSTIANRYQGFYKDGNGDAHLVNMRKVSVKTRPKPTEVDLEELLVHKATPAIITPTRRKKSARPDQRTLVAGDAQYPFHDPRAVALFHEAVRVANPDNVVILGDMLDLPSMSKYKQRPEWVASTNDAIQMYHDFLAQVRSDAPNARVYSIHGNHEQRLVDYTARNAMEVLGLRRANQKMGVLTIQYLVGYDELEVEYVDGYPNGILWLEDNLKFIHGTNTAKGGSNAAKYLKDEHDTTIYGHTHRIEVAMRTVNRRFGKEVIRAASPGALCKVDGTVPGYHYTPDGEGNIVKKAEDWQNGLLLIDHKGLRHSITPIEMFDDEGILIDGKWHNVDVK